MLRPWRRTRTSRSRFSPASASDYERYLNTDELLALQKTADEWVHRDELLFQTVHQSSELWLKLAWNDVEAATEHAGRATRSRRRSGCCAGTSVPPIRDDAARHARADVAVGVPGDPQGARPRQRLRLARLARDPPRDAALGQAFHALREQAGLSLVDVYVQGASTRSCTSSPRR
jgi:tryptophan 2,3-dioxygenase